MLSERLTSGSYVRKADMGLAAAGVRLLNAG